MTHSRLTEAQARATRGMYRRLIRLSRERREFTRVCRSMGWTPEHTAELWTAHLTLWGLVP